MLIKKLFSDASQAQLAVSYRNVKIKVHTKIADIYFNKECLRNKVTPHYAKIKMNVNCTAAKKTKEQAEIKYVKNMIKQLYREKDQLSLQLYSRHLEFQEKYGGFAFELLHGIVSKEVEEIMEQKYAKINNKLDNLILPWISEDETEEVSRRHNFQKRVVNLTELQFDKEETKVLEYGLKHNFVTNKKKEKDIIATDIEANIRMLKDVNHCAVRQEVTGDFPTIYEKRTPDMKEDLNKCKEIKKKLEENSVLALKADKSNAIVIMDRCDYIKKTEDFIRDNNFTELPRDPTEKYQRELSDAVKKCNKVIAEELRPRLNILNSKAPVMKGIPKIHKKNVPIRPLVNFKSAPTYVVSKLLSSRLCNHLELEYEHNVKNSYEFVDRVRNINIEKNSRLVSFDISSLYTNVPVNETVNLLKSRLENNGVEKSYVNQLVKLLKIVLKQNYFRFNNRFYSQPDGLAMGSPLSAIISEVFLQHQEKSILEKLKMKHEVLMYVRYVDDVLIIFNEKNEEEAKDMLKIFNDHHGNLTFTSEYEEDSRINFLDLTVKRKEDHLEFDIYRKPTQTDTAINNKSIHPTSHKTSSFRAMLHRAYKIPLSEASRKREITTIKNIARANGYRPALIDDLGTKILRKIRNQDRIRSQTTLKNGEEKSTKFAVFNYTGTVTRKIANQFKKYGVSIAYKTQNTMSGILCPKIEEDNQFDRPGIYKINCEDCDNFYVGQTVNFVKRFKNHMSAWRNNKPDRSNVAKHLLENGHCLSSIEENLKIVKTCKKGNIMNAWEELYIFKEKCKDRDKLINEQVNFDSAGTYRNLYV